jgi:hypothetical protein
MARIDCYGTYYFSKENKLQKVLIISQLINSHIIKHLSSRLVLNLEIRLIPKQNINTTLEKILMYNIYDLV